MPQTGDPQNNYARRLLVDENASLRAENDRLKRYARHKPDCACLSHQRSDDGGWTFKFPPQPCTCGLTPPADTLEKERLRAAVQAELCRQACAIAPTADTPKETP
jgi:hypothetical protein